MLRACDVEAFQSVVLSCPQLFLDDSRMKNFTSCFKEKVFLNFFFKNIKRNKSGRYEQDFPYISLCGIERNFIRCDDVPIVYTHLLPNDGGYKLIIAYSDLWYPFTPESLYMLPETASKHAGRIYHKAEDRFDGYGLIRSQLAQEIDSCFIVDEHKVPVQFKWKDGRTYQLSHELIAKVQP